MRKDVLANWDSNSLVLLVLVAVEAVVPDVDQDPVRDDIVEEDDDAHRRAKLRSFVKSDK